MTTPELVYATRRRETMASRGDSGPDLKWTLSGIFGVTYEASPSVVLKAAETPLPTSGLSGASSVR